MPVALPEIYARVTYDHTCRTAVRAVFTVFPRGRRNIGEFLSVDSAIHGPIAHKMTILEPTIAESYRRYGKTLAKTAFGGAASGIYTV